VLVNDRLTNGLTTPPDGVMALALESAEPLLTRLHGLLSCPDDPRLRHRAFMLLQRLGGCAATLFRRRAEDEECELEAATGEAA
jgi:hypothetical protein